MFYSYVKFLLIICISGYRSSVKSLCQRLPVRGLASLWEAWPPCERPGLSKEAQPPVRKRRRQTCNFFLQKSNNAYLRGQIWLKNCVPRQPRKLKKPTEDRLHSWSAPPFIMGWDCLWNSEKHNDCAQNTPAPGDQYRDKLNKGLGTTQYSILCETCLNLGPLGHESLYHQHCAPSCFRGSLVQKWKKTCAFYALYCSLWSQRQSRPIMKGGADQLCSLSYELFLIGTYQASIPKL